MQRRNILTVALGTLLAGFFTVGKGAAAKALPKRSEGDRRRFRIVSRKCRLVEVRGEGYHSDKVYECEEDIPEGAVIETLLPPSILGPDFYVVRFQVPLED